MLLAILLDFDCPRQLNHTDYAAVAKVMLTERPSTGLTPAPNTVWEGVLLTFSFYKRFNTQKIETNLALVLSRFLIWAKYANGDRSRFAEESSLPG